MAESQYGFPTEVLSLPSNGLLYSEDSPLRSGTIDVKYMTAKEEDILTSNNLIDQGIVITKLLESVIADSKIKLNDMLIGDKNALMIGTRILGYGADYKISLTDPDTQERVEHTVDLSKLKNKSIDESLLKNGNLFSFELPNSKRVVEFKLLTHKDERNIDSELKGLQKISKVTGVESQLTTRLKHQIISVDGETDKKFISNFVDNEFLALDTKEFRNYHNSIQPDIVFEQEYTNELGESHTVNIPIGIRFFWPET